MTTSVIWDLTVLDDGGIVLVLWNDTHHYMIQGERFSSWHQVIYVLQGIDLFAHVRMSIQIRTLQDTLTAAELLARELPTH